MAGYPYICPSQATSSVSTVYSMLDTGRGKRFRPK